MEEDWVTPDTVAEAKAAGWCELSTKGVPRIMVPQGTTVVLWHPKWGWFDQTSGVDGWRPIDAPPAPNDMSEWYAEVAAAQAAAAQAASDSQSWSPQ